MTTRDKKYIFIVLILLSKVNRVIRDTNLHIEEQERLANEELESLLQKQTEQDAVVLNTWLENTSILMEENIQLTKQIEVLKSEIETLKKSKKKLKKNLYLLEEK